MSTVEQGAQGSSEEGNIVTRLIPRTKATQKESRLERERNRRDAVMSHVACRMR